MFAFRHFALPKLIYDIYFIPFFIFQSAILLIALYLIIGKIIKFPFLIIKYVLEKIKTLNERYQKLRTKKVVVKFDESRRAFIRTSTVLMTGVAFTGAGIGVIGKDDYEIKKHSIKIYGLPEELKGLRIIQFNDIHSGPYMEIDQMTNYCKIINSLSPDLIIIPGDITNSLSAEIHPFIEAFKNLKSKYGVYVTLGNHDYFSDPDYIAGKISSDTPFKMLRNDSEILNINGKNVILLGVEDTRSSGSQPSPVLLKYLDETILKAAHLAEQYKLEYNNTPKLMLFHKPYFFKEILSKNIDLIFSGHTHGGQVVLARIGDLNLSIAGAVSPYISGLYQEKNSQMYISDGLGTVGIPIRLNCPPEITILTLE
jgi:predicted MPP superfamily phosphohydrolase